MDRTTSSTAPLKTQAKALRIYLAEQGTELTHSQALEAVARSHGFKDWNTASARHGDPELEKQEDFVIDVIKRPGTVVPNRGQQWKVDVVVTHTATGAKADDFFEGFFTDAEIERRASEMATVVAAHLALLVGVRAPASLTVGAWVYPDGTSETQPGAPDRRITVNGSEHMVPGGEISYASVLQLAYPGIHPTAVLSVVAKGLRFAGSLTPGQSVVVEEGMIFSAYDTSSA